MSFSSLFNQTTLPQHTCRIRPALWLFSFAFVSPPDDLPFANKMSYCKEEGKDKIIFMSTEDLSKPSSVSFPEDEPAPGLILASGEINWNCPCLGGMATGPCGVEFREAFSCFHYRYLPELLLINTRIKCTSFFLQIKFKNFAFYLSFYQKRVFQGFLYEVCV